MAERKTDFLDVDSLSELRGRFRKPGWALRLFEWLRWPDGRVCPHCAGADHLPIRGRRAGLYECRACRRQFSATSRTPLHKTKLPIEVWMEAAFLIASSSKGVSSVVLAKQLGVSQKTAWKMGHAIRLMMRPRPDGDRTLAAAGPGFASRGPVDPSAGEHLRGHAHASTAEAFRLYTRRARFGVWHRWSETHEQRYLDELVFHWDHRPRSRRRDGRRHRIVQATPIILRMRQIFSNADGRRLTFRRRTGGISETEHKL
jgi:transposase-like protein